MKLWTLRQRASQINNFPEKNWEHPGAQNHRPQASGRGAILVWVFPVRCFFFRKIELGRGLTKSKPIQIFCSLPTVA